MTMMSMLIMMSMTIMMNMTPIMMIMTILILSCTMMMNEWMKTSNAWMPLIFSLAFLGGMMIIFMYIVSISTQQPKKNKNKQPILFVFGFMSLWHLKYGNSTNMTHMILSEFFSQYITLCTLIALILFISTKIINSPFKALKGAF